jgi:DNA repair exonuclease SbcCD nuclease subunit
MKIATFTDIHFGCRGNSIQHLEDCQDYTTWFIKNVKKHKCEAIVFLGDWFENRNSINISTLNSSYDCLKILDDLGLPIFFCIGNHDLYHRENRSLYSTYHFNSFKNVKIVDDPYFEDNMAFFPYLFKQEYPDAAAQIVKKKPKYVFGHFEFKNFVITGTDRRMEHGHDHKAFTGPEHVFSGHFHKRQATDNIIYTGNTFPTNYGDAWDDERGMCILDTVTTEVKFIDWLECPKFRKVKLSDVLNDTTLKFPEKCRVKCVIDTEISYSDAQSLKDEMLKSLNLREFTLEENIIGKQEVLEGEEMQEIDLSSLNDAVIKMLETGITDMPTIESSRLISIYSGLS